jgi:biopolymer transport protein ExbD
MPVKVPGRRAGSGVALRQVKRNIESKTARSLSASLNLTSMVDFMSVIVIFLLMNFSASGDFTHNQADIIPPDAVRGAELVRVPIISISDTEILFEQVRVESSRAVLAESEDYTLPRLTDALKKEQEAFKEIRKGQEFDGKILIQADEQVPYKLIRRVFLAAAKAGYPNISYVVRLKGAGTGTP